MKRKTINQPTPGASAEPMLPRMKSPKPRYIGTFRPIMSEIGPTTIWPRPIVMKKARRVICTLAGLAVRSLPIEGNAGRYISMANGPIADKSPRTIATRRKRVSDDRFFGVVVAVIIKAEVLRGREREID